MVIHPYGIIGFIVVCLIIGFGLYLLGLAPLDPTIKQIVRVVVILIFIIYLIYFLTSLFGLTSGMYPVRMR